MTKEYWTITEIIERYQVDARFLEELEEGEILCPTCDEESPEKRFPVDELEKVRLARILSEEMDVNLPGIEVILRMRQNMLEMRAQFDAILEDLARHIKEAFDDRY